LFRRIVATCQSFAPQVADNLADTVEGFFTGSTNLIVGP